MLARPVKGSKNKDFDSRIFSQAVVRSRDKRDKERRYVRADSARAGKI